MALLENYVAPPPPLRELENGAVRIAGTRVSLDSVIHHFNQGRTPEDIVRSFTTLKLRDVYAITAYYLDHRDDVDAYIQRQEVKAEELRREIEANQPSNAEFRARLDARLREKEALHDGFLTDEDFDADIVRGVLRFVPELDVETVQELSLTNVDDTILLAWAVQDNRFILTHDVNTMNGFALDRVRAGLPMPGVIAVRKLALIGLCINDLVYVVQAGNENDFRDQVRYVPL